MTIFALWFGIRFESYPYQTAVLVWNAILATIGHSYLCMDVESDIDWRKTEGHPRLMWTWVKSLYFMDPVTVALYRRRMRRDPLSTGRIHHRLDGDKIWDSIFHRRRASR